MVGALSLAPSISDSPISTIGRLRCLRALQSPVYKSAPIRLKIMVASEFAEPMCNILNICHICITSRNRENGDVFESTIANFHVDFNGCATIEFSAPDKLSSYDVAISAKEQNLDSLETRLILPCIIENLHVVDTTPRSTQPILPCQRKFISILEPKICINITEDYGLTLGSHIYDSSIVLVRYCEYLRSSNSTDAGRRGMVIELGSGCGLVGIWLSSSFKKVILTDKLYQLPHLHTNIERNSASGNTVATLLDWADPDGVQNFKATHLNTSRGPDLIVAADVLYDRDMALAFCAVLRTIACCHTDIIVAQKLRPVQAEIDSRFDISQQPGLLATALLTEADVTVWKVAILEAPLS